MVREWLVSRPVTVVCVCVIEKSVCMYGVLSTGHRAHNVYVGVHLPGFKRRSHHRRHRHHHKNGIGKDPSASSTDDDDRPSESIYVLYCTVFFSFLLFLLWCALSLQATLCLCNRTIKNAWAAEAVCRRILYWGETVDLITKRLRMFGGILSCSVNTLLHQLIL